MNWLQFNTYKELANRKYNQQSCAIMQLIDGSANCDMQQLQKIENN